MEVFTEKLSSNLDKNIALMDRLLHYGDSFDLIRRTMHINGTRLVMYYIDGFVKGEEIQRLMLYFVTLKDFGDGSAGAARRFAEGSVPSAEVDVTDSVDSIITMVLSGCTALLGTWGFVAGVLLVILLIATNKTVNGKRSYLYPFIPFDGRALARLVFRLKKRD